MFYLLVKQLLIKKDEILVGGNYVAVYQQGTPPVVLPQERKIFLLEVEGGEKAAYFYLKNEAMRKAKEEFGITNKIINL